MFMCSGLFGSTQAVQAPRRIVQVGRIFQAGDGFQRNYGNAFGINATFSDTG